MTRPQFDAAGTLVVKVGSSLLQGGETVLTAIAADIAELRRRGCRVVIVSSGAVRSERRR